jgi:hypothetical protein
VRQYVHQVLLSRRQNDEHMKAPLSPLKHSGYPTVQLLLPASIHKRTAVYSESQLYMISLLAKKTLYSGDPPQSYHPLSIRILAKQLGSKPRERHIEALITSGHIQILKNNTGKETYESGTRSKSYRLSPELADEILRDELSAYYTPPESLLAKRLMKLRISLANEAIIEAPSLKREYDWLQEITFNDEKAESFKHQFEQTGMRDDKVYSRAAAIRLESDLRALSNLQTGDFLFSYNDIRLETRVTSAMRQMRQCLEDSHGNAFVELDMRSSQVVFLCKALVHYYSESQDVTRTADHLWKFFDKSVDLSNIEGILPTDVIAFINHVVYGDIYEELYMLATAYSEEWTHQEPFTSVKTYVASSTQKMITPRKDFKKAVMQEILFNYYTRSVNTPILAKAFNESYYHVTKFLEQLTEESTTKERSRELARLVQKYEAHFFHFIALDLLEAQFPNRTFYVVHDSIGIPEDIVEDAQVLLNEAIAKHFGLPSDLGLIRH